MMLSDPALWLANVLLAVGALFLIVVAIVVEFDTLSTAWRRVLYVVAAQQAVIAYSSVEAWARDVEPELRALAIGGSLLALALAVIAVLVDTWTRHDARTR